jgi:thiamine kinase-like enzyme
LRRDPKRSYKGTRVFVFYVKVLINSLNKISERFYDNPDIVYRNSRKEIHFFREFIRVKYFNKRIQDKYQFLIKHGIIIDTKYKKDYFELPLYSTINEKTLSFKTHIVKDTLLKLARIRSFRSENYLFDLQRAFEKINVINKDIEFVKKIWPKNDATPIYKSLVHGDLWSGNILMLSADAVIIDWDDLTLKSFTYDIFYYEFQECNADLQIFYRKYEEIKKRTLSVILYISEGAGLLFNIKDFDLYYKIFIIERMLKRYND